MPRHSDFASTSFHNNMCTPLKKERNIIRFWCMLNSRQRTEQLNGQCSCTILIWNEFCCWSWWKWCQKPDRMQEVCRLIHWQFAWMLNIVQSTPPLSLSPLVSQWDSNQNNPHPFCYFAKQSSRAMMCDQSTWTLESSSNTTRIKATFTTATAVQQKAERQIYTILLFVVAEIDR